MRNKSIARNHHYLPVGYLAAFTSTGTKQGKFNVLNKKNGYVFDSSPRNVGSKKDFNRVNREGFPIDKLENDFASFEGRVIAAIMNLKISNLYPCSDDLNLIVNLITLIAVRNPRMRKLIDSSREKELRLLDDYLLSNEDIFNRCIAEARAAGVKIPVISFDGYKTFTDSGNYKFDFYPGKNAEGHLIIEFDAFEKLLPIFGKRYWSVLLAPENGPEFICCDHPVTFAWKNQLRCNIGFAHKNTEVFFPLDRKIGIFGVFETPLNKIVRCTPLQVGILNKRLLNNAELHIYSAQNSFTVGDAHGLYDVRCEKT